LLLLLPVACICQVVVTSRYVTLTSSISSQFTLGCVAALGPEPVGDAAGRGIQ
jgi:hypothetical protein